MNSYTAHMDNWPSGKLTSFNDFARFIVVKDRYKVGKVDAGTWYFVPKMPDDGVMPLGERYIYWGTFGDSWVAGHPCYTHAEIYGRDEKDEFARTENVGGMCRIQIMDNETLVKLDTDTVIEVSWEAVATAMNTASPINVTCHERVKNGG